MSHDLSIGELLTTPQHRDAVHFAIAPVTTKDISLSPGQHIGLVDGSTTIVTAKGDVKLIGIVDPFLKGRVYRGDQFWIFLYMQTVTGMRHHWKHPAFPEDAAPAPTPVLIVAMSESERWLRNFADEVDQSYETIMSYAEREDYIVEGGRYEGMGVGPEFWQHYKNVTGKEGPGHGLFSCSC